jgi:sugar/nucleoside kinase (ribokinase family)
MFSEVQKVGVVTSLDFSLPDTESESGKIGWLEIMKRVLPFTDIFAPSLEEALQVMMPDEYEKIVSASDNQDIVEQIPFSMLREMGKKIVDCGVKILLVKAAHRGTYLLTGDISKLNIKKGLNLDEKTWNNREFWCPSYLAEPTKIKNATGAGDTAIAGFLAAILDGENPYVSLKCATMAGRNNLYCNDLYEELTGWDEMTTEIKLSDNVIIDLNKK